MTDNSGNEPIVDNNDRNKPVDTHKRTCYICAKSLDAHDRGGMLYTGPRHVLTCSNCFWEQTKQGKVGFKL